MKIDLNAILNPEHFLMPIISLEQSTDYVKLRKEIHQEIEENSELNYDGKVPLRLDYSAGFWLINSWRNELGPITPWVLRKDLSIHTLDRDVDGQETITPWTRLNGYEGRLWFLRDSLNLFGNMYLPTISNPEDLIGIYGKTAFERRKSILR